MIHPDELRFCVGNDPDPVLRRKALRGLRAMARLGRAAEAVLRDIESKGWSDRRSWWVGGRKGKDWHLPRFRGPVPFPLHEPCTRESVPGYRDIRVELEGPVSDRHGSTPYNAVEVVLSRPVLRWGGRRVAWRRERSVVGKLRITSTGGTLYLSVPERKSRPEQRREEPGAIRILKEVGDRRKALMAANVATWVADDRADGAPPLAVDLRRKLPGWLLEDGMVDLWLDELRRFLSDRKIVSHVMTV